MRLVRRVWTASKDWIQSLSNRLSRRADLLSADGPVSGRREASLLVFLPALTFGAVCLASAMSGVAYRPRCNSSSNFIANLFFQKTHPSTCQSVPFLSDVPTVILSFTSPFALVSYRLLRRRLASLLGSLEGTGLLTPQSGGAGLVKGIRRLERAVDLTPLTRLGLFATSVAMVTWLYSRNLRDGHLFNTLGRPGPNGGTTADALRETWWANYHHHPALAVVCVSIGSVGVMYALRASWLYMILGGVLYITRNAPPDTLPLHYVPRWKDKSYGWSPVTGVLMLIYVSTVNFAISMVSVFDMLRNETWTLGVAVFFALLGVISNLAIILMSLFRMVAAHQAVEQRLRESLSSASLTTQEYVVAASELVAWKRIPVASFSGSVVKITPGLYAVFQFVRTFSSGRP